MAGGCVARRIGRLWFGDVATAGGAPRHLCVATFAIPRRQRRTAGVTFALVSLALCAVMVLSTRSMAASNVAARDGGPALEDLPEPFVPRQPATETDRDRVEAVALFCAGRAHERRQEYARALRCYERALRCDAQSSTIVGATVATAIQLKRIPEAIRYALKAAELPNPDPVLLRGLGGDLAQNGEWSQAIALYEKALAAGGHTKDTASDVLLRMELGRLCCLTEKYKEAADSFARVLYAIDHRDAFALDEPLVRVLLGGKPASSFQLMGECFLRADRPREALSLFEKADAASHDEPLLRFNRARVYLKTGRPADAITDIEAALAGHLDDQAAAPYETLADALAALGRKGELLDRLETLRNANPGNAVLGYYLAAQYEAAGERKKAERLYPELLKIAPTITGYRNLVELYRQDKQFDAMLTVLGEALEKTSTLEVLAAEAQSISGDAQSMAGLVQAARRRLTSDPAGLGYGMRLAVALLSLEAQRYDTASEFFELALAAEQSARRPSESTAGLDAGSTAIARLDRRPSRKAEVLMVWGIGLLSGQRAAEAAKVFQRGIDEKALPADNPAFEFYLAGALALADRPEEALAAAKAAAGKKSDSARYLVRPAWVLYMAKRYDAATRAYRELIGKLDADRTSTETRDVLREARLALSNIAVIQGNVDDAEEWIEQVLDEFPDDDGALNDLGYLWADQNKHLGVPGG